MTLNLLEKRANGSSWEKDGNDALQHSWRRQMLWTREIWEQREDSLTWNLQYSEQKNKAFAPVSLQKKCREAICSLPQLLSELCRTQFSTLSRKLRPESPSFFEAGSSKLHPQIVDIFHPVCTSRSYITCAQHPVAVVKFSIIKPGVHFLKCLHQRQLSSLEMYLHRGQRRFLTLLIYSLWSGFCSEGRMCTVAFLMLWHPPVVVSWNAPPL